LVVRGEERHCFRAKIFLGDSWQHVRLIALSRCGDGLVNSVRRKQTGKAETVRAKVLGIENASGWMFHMLNNRWPIDDGCTLFRQ
jgi:hypothetical protein